MVIYYLIAVNVLLLLLMAYDKVQAKWHRYRVSEKILLTLGVFGGGLGGIISQQIFHHKTRKKKFYVAFIIGIVVNFVFIYLFDK